MLFLSLPLSFLSLAPCEGNTFFCHSNMCINNTLVCNGLQNCVYPWDENHCKGNGNRAIEWEGAVSTAVIQNRGCGSACLCICLTVTLYIVSLLIPQCALRVSHSYWKWLSLQSRTLTKETWRELGEPRGEKSSYLTSLWHLYTLLHFFYFHLFQLFTMHFFAHRIEIKYLEGSFLFSIEIFQNYFFLPYEIVCSIPVLWANLQPTYSYLNRTCCLGYAPF